MERDLESTDLDHINPMDEVIKGMEQYHTRIEVEEREYVDPEGNVHRSTQARCRTVSPGGGNGYMTLLTVTDPDGNTRYDFHNPEWMTYELVQRYDLQLGRFSKKWRKHRRNV
ncbi:MAG: hypothetical protein ACYDAS_01475 [Patescibacteria group bacterium]